MAERYRLGISVTAVSVQSVSPPIQVADAFREVASAREDRDRIIKEAESYANAAVPAAEGDAARFREEALASREEKVRQASGDAARFVRAYEAYRVSPDVTQPRLYLEAVEEIMPRLKVISVDRQGGKAPIDLNLFPRTSPPPAPAGSNAPAPDQNAARASLLQALRKTPLQVWLMSAVAITGLASAVAPRLQLSRPAPPAAAAPAEDRDAALSQPVEAVYEAARGGNLDAYFAQLGEPLRSRLQRVRSERGNEYFRDYLHRSTTSIKGVAVDLLRKEEVDPETVRLPWSSPTRTVTRLSGSS